MKSKLLIATALAALFATLCQGRIGETEKQCEERYGTATPVDGRASEKRYRKGPFVIIAHFHEGACDYLLFRKAEQNTIGIAKEISENERELLMKANGGDRKWKKLSGFSLDDPRETEGGELRAEYGAMDHALAIVTREAMKRHDDAKKAEEAKKLKEF